MKIDHHTTHTALVIVLPEGEGRLFDEDLDGCIEQILQLKDRSIGTIAFNMSARLFLNSTGLGDLVKVKDALLDRDIRLVLTNISPRVRSIIDMVGVDSFFSIVENEDGIR
jgi:anti-anti-sigma factor